MKITGPKGAGSTTGPRGTQAGGGGGFKLPSLDGPEGTAPTGGVSRMSGVMGVDALLALQDVGGPLERKRRAVSRASRMLDVLDEVKIGLLDGNCKA
jgi:hypothetical protein